MLLDPRSLSDGERAALRAQLLAYCERDTEVLVKMFHRLAALA